MSRRRAGDGLANEDTIPAPSTASSKARLTGARFGRFVRTRPLATILAVLACVAVVVLAITTGHSFLTPRLHQDETLVTVEHDDDVRQHLNDTAADEDTGEDTHGARCIREIPTGRFGAVSPTCVTAEYFMELAIGEESIGRVKIGIFGEAVPKSAANYHALFTCTEPFDNEKCFKGDSFHRVVPGFVIQGGSKATGHSIYGGTFREEVSEDHHSVLSHSEMGVIASAEYPIGSQFYILLGEQAKYLDKNHVVFGYVVEGMDVVKKVESTKLEGEKPVQRVSIVNCGQVNQ